MVCPSKFAIYRDASRFVSLPWTRFEVERQYDSIYLHLVNFNSASLQIKFNTLNEHNNWIRVKFIINKLCAGYIRPRLFLNGACTVYYGIIYYYNMHVLGAGWTNDEIFDSRFCFKNVFREIRFNCSGETSAKSSHKICALRVYVGQILHAFCGHYRRSWL